MRTQWHITKEVPTRRTATNGERVLKCFLLAFLLLPFGLFAQQGVTTFGMQIKPIIPLDFFEPLTELNHQGEDILSGSFRLTGGRTFGMSVRRTTIRPISLHLVLCA